jgi:hypothetical protein
MVERSAKRTDPADFTENPQKLGRVWPYMVHQSRREAASGVGLQAGCQLVQKLQTRIRDRVSFITERKTQRRRASWAERVLASVLPSARGASGVQTAPFLFDTLALHYVRQRVVSLMAFGPPEGVDGWGPKITYG